MKAAAVEAGTGRMLARAGLSLAVAVTPDGGREQQPDAILAALARIGGRLRRQLGPAWRRVAALGLAAQGGSAILVDGDTGQAGTPVQLWSDTRPLHLLSGIAARKTPSYWKRLSGLDGPGAGLARIAWLRERHGRLFDHGCLYVGVGEFAYFYLTGAWRQDAGSAIQQGCYDVRKQTITEEPLTLVGLDASRVAPMRQGHQTHPLSAAGAKLLGLSADLPVAGPYMDHEAGYLSACGVSDRPVQCSLGTAWVGNFVLPPGREPEAGLNLILPSPVGPGQMICRVMLAGNASWDWAMRSFVGGTTARHFARAERAFDSSLLPPAGLVALPWLTRPNLLNARWLGAGGFLGVNPLTTHDDLLRAVAAGMCFEYARMLKPVVDAGVVDTAMLGGGASNASHFRSLLAGLLWPLPVVHSQDDFAGAKGTLYAFDRRVVSPQVQRVAAPPARVRKQIAEGYESYLAACRLLGLTK